MAVRVRRAPPTSCCITAWAASNGHRGLWGFVRGGMGAVSNAIADSARARGAEIRTNAPVERSWSKDGRAAGVVLERRRGDPGAQSSRAISIPSARSCIWWTQRLAGRLRRLASGSFRCEGTSLQDQPGAERPAGVSKRLPGAPGPAASARPCTSARRSNTSSAPGTTPSTAVRRIRR